MVVAIIVAAGEGKRMEGFGGKQFLPLLGKPLLAHTLQAFQECQTVEKIIVVTAEEKIGFCLKQVVDKYGFSKVLAVIPGGLKRQDSVGHGLEALPKETSVVLVHDGARPLVSAELINRAVESLEGWDGAVLAVPLVDTIKKVEAGCKISQTIDRTKLYAAQTPQVFPVDVLKKAYGRAKSEGTYGTDDSYLVERAGFRVRVVVGSPDNIKVTTPIDLLVAEAIIKKRLKPED